MIMLLKYLCLMENIFDYVFGTIVLTLILYGQFIKTNSYSESQCSSTIMKEVVGEINSGIKCK
jgi:hypothetical protein